MSFVRKFCLALMASGALLFQSVVADAQPPAGKGKPDKGEMHQGQGKGKTKDKDKDKDGAGILYPSVRAGIEWSAARQLALGSGLIGYSALPPGIQKNLTRGKPLPPGIAKKVLGGSMLQGLPVHPGYKWYAVGRDLILVEAATLIVADVLSNIFE